MSDVLGFRLADEEDLRFVIASFVDSYRTAHAAGLIAMDDWHEVMTRQVRKLIGRPGVKVHVAYHPESDRSMDLYGWIAVEQEVRIPTKVREAGRWVERLEPADCPLVHYVFVKQPYRLAGIARALFAEAGVKLDDRFLYTAKTALVSRLAPKMPRAQWSPLVARFTKSDPLEMR